MGGWLRSYGGVGDGVYRCGWVVLAFIRWDRWQCVWVWVGGCLRSYDGVGDGVYGCVCVGACGRMVG